MAERGRLPVAAGVAGSGLTVVGRRHRRPRRQRRASSCGSLARGGASAGGWGPRRRLAVGGVFGATPLSAPRRPVAAARVERDGAHHRVADTIAGAVEEPSAAGVSARCIDIGGGRQRQGSCRKQRRPGATGRCGFATQFRVAAAHAERPTGCGAAATVVRRAHRHVRPVGVRPAAAARSRPHPARCRLGRGVAGSRPECRRPLVGRVPRANAPGTFQFFVAAAAAPDIAADGRTRRSPDTVRRARRHRRDLLLCQRLGATQRSSHPGGRAADRARLLAGCGAGAGRARRGDRLVSGMCGALPHRLSGDRLVRAGVFGVVRLPGAQP
eukprot:ctg_1608.g638